MDSRIQDGQVCSSGSCLTAEGFPDHHNGATPILCQSGHATSANVWQHRQESTNTQGMPSHQLTSQQCMSETSEALKKLNEAPSINSLPSRLSACHIQPQVGINNVDVSSAGTSSLSTAQALLHQSLDSGSLTAAVGGLKEGQNQFNMRSNISSDSPLITAGIFNILGSSLGSSASNTSSEDNTKHSVDLPKNVNHDTPPASSYFEMTARTDIGERLKRDFDSITFHMPKKVGISMSVPSNDLDRSRESGFGEAGACALPNNITNQNHSLSANEDWSLTSPKTVTTRSTQTYHSADQDQDSYGGASSAGTAVQTMSSGPASSLPSDDVLVRKLKRPIIQWLQRKLETNVGMAWQDLVDLHDWDYERITDFESSCVGKSPFCMLLAEPEFQMYRMSDLKRDLEKLPRFDILHDLDEVMRRHYK